MNKLGKNKIEIFHKPFDVGNSELLCKSVVFIKPHKRVIYMGKLRALGSRKIPHKRPILCIRQSLAYGICVKGRLIAASEVADRALLVSGVSVFIWSSQLCLNSLKAVLLCGQYFKIFLVIAPETDAFFIA